MSGDRWKQAEMTTAYLTMKSVPPEEQDRRILEHYGQHMQLVGRMLEARRLRYDIWRNGGNTDSIDQVIHQGVEVLKEAHWKDLGIDLTWEQMPPPHTEPADKIARYMKEEMGRTDPEKAP